MLMAFIWWRKVLKLLHQVLSTLPESWFACVGRANSST